MYRFPTFSFRLRPIPILLLSLFIPLITPAPLDPSSSSASAITQIRNTINLLSILQDTKNFTALDQVYTADVNPFGLDYVQCVLEASLADATTLHYADTDFVELGPAGDTATAVSYVQAIYFADEVVGVVDVNGDAEEGQGEGSQGEGGSCTFFETNTFEMVLRGGRWLIQNQQLEIVAKIGNYSLVPDNDAITTTCAPFESST
ncbi:hypothetical protein MMC24_003060 [Lignoscripta atroalba]|nr:hypothetical protein [Lignoscripta atroalba]